MIVKKNDIKIATILPYKESYTLEYASAVSLWVSEFFNKSTLKNSNYIYGNANSKNYLTENYINIPLENLELKFRSTSNEYIEKFEVKTPSSERLITLLSGGNQQKVLLSRWLLRELKIIILDEPTRGVDIGAKTEVLGLINNLAKEGLSVILMTSEMNDLLSLSDRILVMANGEIKKEFLRNKVTQEEIFKASVS